MSIASTQVSSRARLINGLAIAGLVAVVASLQLVSGAYHSDFAADPDEPTHVVSSLLVRDYLSAGAPRNPLHFAQDYYVHYPKVAIGHFPPLLYASEAVWMLAFGRTRAAMLALIGVADLALLLSVFFWVQRDCGALAGFLAAAALAAPNFMQVAIASVAPNIFLALLAFWAAAVYGRYMETRQRRDALWFAILVLAAIGIHGRGVALILIPVIAPLLTLPSDRRSVWIRRTLVLIAVITLLVLAPFVIRQSFPTSFSATAGNARKYLSTAFMALSWPVAALVVLGAISAKRFLEKRWLAMLALLLSCWVFHSVVNVPFEARFLATSAPAIAVLFGAGVHFLTQRFASGTAKRAVAAAIVLIACSGIVRAAFPLWRKPDPGYHRLSPEITPPGPGTLLIGGDGTQEGAFIAEIDLRDRRQDHIVLRASKMLAISGWNEWGYHTQFSTAGEVANRLDQLHVALVLVAGPPQRPHLVQLMEALTENPNIWKEEPSGLQEVRFFRRIGPVPEGPVHIRMLVRTSYFELDR